MASATLVGVHGPSPQYRVVSRCALVMSVNAGYDDYKKIPGKSARLPVRIDWRPRFKARADSPHFSFSKKMLKFL
jgi:hypothetical protein